MSREHSPDVQQALAGMDEDKERLQRMTMDMWKAEDGAMYPLDLYANGAISRSFALASGFRAMIRDFNLICAGALLRLQLDTAIRFNAAYLAPHACDFALAVIQGQEVRKLKDRDNQLMTDAYLVKSLAADYSWIEAVYKNTSGYVHFSGTHIFSTCGKVHREEARIEIALGPKDKEYPDSVYLEAIDAFRQATKVFTDHLAGWIVLKRDEKATRVSLQPFADGEPDPRAYLYIGRP